MARKSTQSIFLLCVTVYCYALKINLLIARNYCDKSPVSRLSLSVRSKSSFVRCKRDITTGLANLPPDRSSDPRGARSQQSWRAHWKISLKFNCQCRGNPAEGTLILSKFTQVVPSASSLPSSKTFESGLVTFHRSPCCILCLKLVSRRKFVNRGRTAKASKIHNSALRRLFPYDLSSLSAA